MRGSAIEAATVACGTTRAAPTLSLAVESSSSPSWGALRELIESRLCGLNVVLSEKQSITLSGVHCVDCDDARWRARGAGAGSWHRCPHGFVFVAACRDRAAYQSVLRPLLAKWSARMSREEGRWLVIVVPHGESSALTAIEHERWTFEQIRKDLQPNAQASVCLIDSGALAHGVAPGAAADALDVARCDAQWARVVESLQELIVATFYLRTKQYRLRLNELLAQLNGVTGRTEFWTFFEAQESFAFMFERFQQHQPALMLYEEIEKEWLELSLRSHDVRGISRNKGPVARGAFARPMFEPIGVDEAEKASLTARFSASQSVSAVEFTEYLLARQCALLMRIGGVGSASEAMRRVLHATDLVVQRWQDLEEQGFVPRFAHHVRLHTMLAELVDALTPYCTVAWRERVVWLEQRSKKQESSSSSSSSRSRRKKSSRRSKRSKGPTVISEAEIAAEKAKVLAVRLCRGAELSMWHLEALAAALKGGDGSGALRWKEIVGLPWRPSAADDESSPPEAESTDWMQARDAVDALSPPPPPPAPAVAAPARDAVPTAAASGRASEKQSSIAVDDSVANSVRATVLRKYEEGVLSKEECDQILRKHFNFPMHQRGEEVAALREECSFTLNDCLHGTSLDTAFGSARALSALFLMTVDCTLRFNELLERDRFATMLRGKKAALLVTSCSEDVGDKAVVASLKEALGLLRVCCESTWRRKWASLFRVCLSQLAFCFYRIHSVGGDADRTGDPGRAFACACLQLQLPQEHSTGSARHTEAETRTSFLDMALALLRDESSPISPFVHPMLPWAAVLSIDVASASPLEGASEQTPLFIGEPLHCVCVLKSMAGLPMPHGTLVVRFVRQTSDAPVFASGSTAASTSKRRSPLREMFDAEDTASAALPVVEEEIEGTDGDDAIAAPSPRWVGPDDWILKRDLEGGKTALVFTQASQDTDEVLDRGDGMHSVQLTTTCTDAGVFVFDRCWFTIGTMTMVLHRCNASPLLQQLRIATASKPLEADVDLLLPPFAAPEQPTTFVVRVSPKVALPPCTIRMMGASLTKAPSAVLAALPGDHEASPFSEELVALVSVAPESAAAELVFALPPVGVGEVLEVTFFCAAATFAFRRALDSSRRRAMEISVHVESKGAHASRVSATSSGTLPLVVPFQLEKRAFTVPGRAPGALEAASFGVTRYVQCRLVCVAPCALAVVQYSLQLPNAVVKHIGNERSSASSSECIVLESGQQVHATFQVIVAGTGDDDVDVGPSSSAETEGTFSVKYAFAALGSRGRPYIATHECTLGVPAGVVTEHDRDRDSQPSGRVLHFEVDVAPPTWCVVGSLISLEFAVRLSGIECDGRALTPEEESEESAVAVLCDIATDDGERLCWMISGWQRRWRSLRAGEWAVFRAKALSVISGYIPLPTLNISVGGGSGGGGPVTTTLVWQRHAALRVCALSM